MTQEAINMAKALYDLTDHRPDVQLMAEIFETPELTEVLSNPTVSLEQKWKICDEIQKASGLQALCNNFLKMMCKVDEICEIQDILQAYFNLWDEKHQVIRPEVIVDKEPNQDLMDEIQNIITKKYPGKEIHMNVTVDPELMGGYVIRVGQEEWDRSYEGYLKQLEMKLSRR